ncbi:MAG: DinB family protein [Chloroflexi bacterium]|nr:MAG: DinB family protein [Chloroflexota bacterium]
MSISSFLLHNIAGLMFERPTRGLTAAVVLRRLEQSQPVFAQQIEQCADSHKNRALLGHIIGVERWAQARLRQCVSGPTAPDESDAYVPAPDVSFADRVADALRTRSDSVALLGELIDAGVPLTRTIIHNQFGALTVAAWFHYIAMHSMLEAKKMR